MKTYWGEFFSDKDDLIKEFEIDELDIQNSVILFAYYGHDGDVGGEAFVLFLKSGNLFEVNAGHCSCNGIEGQWEPDSTTKAALKMRKWSFYDQDAQEALIKIIDLLPD